jgi:hypothetical protein
MITRKEEAMKNKIIQFNCADDPKKTIGKRTILSSLMCAIPPNDTEDFGQPDRARILTMIMNMLTNYSQSRRC